MNHEDHDGHEGMRLKSALPARVESIAAEIIDAALNVHKALGPGLLESAYQHCLIYELQSRGLQAIREVPVPVIYRDVRLDVGYRLDILVEDEVIIELKAADALSKLNTAQVLTYLRLSGHRLAFLMNFNVEQFRQGVRRIVL